MRYNDPEYKRKIEMIKSVPTTIPSNKIDAEDLSGIAAEDMRDFELRHLSELTQQAVCMDRAEQEATAQGLAVDVLFNELGRRIQAQVAKIESMERVVTE